MEFLKFLEIPESEFQKFHLSKDGSLPVKVLYRVTQADKRTSHGIEYDWDSLVEAVKDAQAEINDGAMFGFLEHPPDSFDTNGNPIGVRKDTNPRLFKALSMWTDSKERDVKSWVIYLNNPLGLHWSDKIRQGECPKVSMTSFLDCNKSGVCKVRKIENFDQVGAPAMSSAHMLQYKDSQTLSNTSINSTHSNDANNSIQSILHRDCGNNKNCHCNNCINSRPVTVSRSGKTFRSGDQLIMKKRKINKDMMSPEEILGQAKLGWLSPEAVVCLEYWIMEAKGMASDMAKYEAEKEANPTVNPTEEETINQAEMVADSQRLLNSINQIQHTLAKASTQNLDEVLVKANTFKLETLKPQIGNVASTNDSILKETVEALKKQVDLLSKDNQIKQEATQANELKKSIETAIDNLLAADVITFGVGKDAINYQRKSFNEDQLENVRETAKDANSPDDAIRIAKAVFHSLSREKAAKYLGDRGYTGKDTQVKGTTAGVEVINKGIGNEVFDKLNESVMSYARQHAPKEYQILRNSQTAAFQEKIKDLKDQAKAKAEPLIAKAEQERLSGRVKDSFNNVDDFMSLFPVESHKMHRDSASQALTTAANAVVLPYFSAFTMTQQFEMLQAAELYRGITRNALVGMSENSVGWGRVYNFGLEFAGDPTGDDPDHELATSADTVFDEMSIRTTRQEFVARDYGLVVRFGRGDAASLMSMVPNYDVLGRLTFRALERLNRRRNTRMLRELFQSSNEKSPISRTDTVANVAPSGSGPLNFIGEYKRGPAGTAFSIGGKTFGGVGSNVDAAVRVKGGNTSATSFANVPIVKNRTQPTHSQFGVITSVTTNPISVTIAAVAKTQGQLVVVSGIQQIVPLPGQTTAHWALDEDGFILLATGAGQGADPTSPQIVVSYSEMTNFIRFGQNPGTTDPSKYFNNFLYKCAENAAAMNGTPNFAYPNAVLMDQLFATAISKASRFDKQESPNGTNLSSVYTMNSLKGSYGDLDFLGTNGLLPYGANRELIMQTQYAAAALLMDETSIPYRAQKADTSTGKIQTLPQLVVDIFTQDCIGVPVLKHPDTGVITNFPFKSIINYDTLPSQTD